MNAFINNKQEIPIASHINPSGGTWSIKEKLWLGLSMEEYKAQFMRNPVNWALVFIFAIGVPLILQRYFFGLATVTHASNDYPGACSLALACSAWCRSLLLVSF